MKPAFWTAVLILALMVGGLSFVSVYLTGSTRDGSDQPTASSPSLTFPIKTFPREGEKVQTTEVNQTGWQDYWFVNETEQEMAVGLNSKGCTCSEVEITVAPPSWMPYLASSAVLGALQQPPRGLDNLTMLAAAYAREHLFPEMPSAESTMLTREFSATVPAGAIGRVRLSWHQPVVKPLVTYADLWMGQRGGSANARLETRVLIAAPLEANKDLNIPTLSERELIRIGKSKPAWIICFSLTRPSFQLKAELLHSRFKPESDPIQVGKPIPLSIEDLQRIERSDEKMHRLHALAGYRIPVTMRAKAKDGTPVEWGRFHRVVELSSTDPDIEPVQVQVSGEVVGDISVGSGAEEGTINLGPFPYTRGKKAAVVLQTDDKTIDLELDKKHMPKYLKANLSAPREEASGHRSWVLKVEVPPKAAQGGFPRADDPDYRDSAIYVKTSKGKADPAPRSVRIPVRGEAN